MEEPVGTNALNLARGFVPKARFEVVSRTSRASLLGRSAITLRLNGVDSNPFHLTMIRRDQLADSFEPSYFGPPGWLSRARDRRERERCGFSLSFSLFLRHFATVERHCWQCSAYPEKRQMTHWRLYIDLRPSRYSVFLVKCSLRLIYAVHGYHEILLFVAPRTTSLGGLFLFETTRGGFCSRRMTSRLRDTFDENRQ